MTQPPIVPDLHPQLASGRFLLGTWLTVLDPLVAEAVAGCGFDFLVADGEHGRVATADLVTLLIGARASGVPCLYRVAANEPIRIMQALDSGASGVVVPQVRTVADVERAVAACRYPPMGLRGIAPRRASDHGRAWDAYLATANGLVTCCVQIETAEALEGLEAILAVPGVDTILVGPNDLAAAIGHTNDLAHPAVEAAIGHILERTRAVGIPAGIWAPDAVGARRRADQGFVWATVGADLDFLVGAATRAAREGRGEPPAAGGDTAGSATRR